jgi:CDP-diacylglycerol--glycerol-3-phosphate 3-phosphatidyltransferase
MSTNPDVPASVRPLTSSDARTAPASPRLVNLPNGLTVLRLVLVPIFVAFLVEGGTGSRIVAFFVFGVASITDLLDGQLARRSGMITDFGKIADPIADKALTGSALITLSVLGELPWWVTAIILVREVAVTVLRFWVIRHGVIAASRGGKIKTVLQIVAIGLYIMPVDIGWVRSAVMAAAVAVTLVTGVDYVARALRLRRAAHSLPADAPRAGIAARSGDSVGSGDVLGPGGGLGFADPPPVSPPVGSSGEAGPESDAGR